MNMATSETIELMDRPVCDTYTDFAPDEDTQSDDADESEEQENAIENDDDLREIRTDDDVNEPDPEDDDFSATDDYEEPSTDEKEDE